MKFEVDVERLVDYGIPLNQYLLCQLVYQQESKILNLYLEQFDKFVTKSDFDNLISKGYLELHSESKGFVFSNLSITKKFIDQFIEKQTKSKLDKECVEDWIDIWYNLFPKGVKSGGYLVRADKNGCLTKLKKFCKIYPEFTKEIILKATSDYLDYYRMKNWKFVSLAHYFVMKDGMSILAGQCELILDKINSGKSVNLELNQYKSDGVIYEDEADIFNSSGNMDRL